MVLIPIEIQNDEILLWWEKERLHIQAECSRQFERLAKIADAHIDGLSTKETVWIWSEGREDLKAKLASEIEMHNRRLASHLDISLQASVKKADTLSQLDGASPTEYATLAAAANGPIGPLGQGVSLYQNHQMGNQLSAIQSSLGAMQSIQMLAAVSSVAGIGVTVASTFVILGKIKALDAKIDTLGKKLDDLPAQWRDMDISKILRKVQHQLERLSEVSSRKDPKPVLETAEATLHEAFDDLHARVIEVTSEAKVNAELVRTLLEGMAVSGAAQIKTLYRLDDTETALVRSKTQFMKMQDLALKMPADKLQGRLGGDASCAQEITRQASQIRQVMASRGALTQRVIELEVAGSRYLAALEDEDEQPLFLLDA